MSPLVTFLRPAGGRPRSGAGGLTNGRRKARGVLWDQRPAYLSVHAVGCVGFASLLSGHHLDWRKHEGVQGERSEFRRGPSVPVPGRFVAYRDQGRFAWDQDNGPRPRGITSGNLFAAAAQMEPVKRTERTGPTDNGRAPYYNTCYT